MVLRKLLLATALLFNIICNAQSIGIGTATPNASAQLDVASTTKGLLAPRMTFVQRNAITTPATGLLIYQTDFSAGFYYYNGSVWIQLNTGSSTNYFTASGNNIYSNNTGNVGIGSLTPNQKLHVTGNIVGEAVNNTSSVSLRLWGGTNNSASIQFYNNITAPQFAGSFGFSGLANSTWISGTATSLNTDGMGIDNSSPLTKLHILGGQDAGFGSTSNGYIMNGSSIGANLVIDNNEILSRNNGRKADLFLQNDSGYVILCGNEQGGVGIGVIAGSSIPAGYLLAVDGKILSEEVKVQLSQDWPDYVFDKKYSLLPLNDLKKYITANKHLPNIPAAADVKKNGIELGDMQKRMMEKIEELTLYILELKTELDKVKKELVQTK